jgi:hypothetical protein
MVLQLEVPYSSSRLRRGAGRVEGVFGVAQVLIRRSAWFLLMTELAII